MSIDITGFKFTKLTAVEPVIKNKILVWRCICDCGNEVFYTASRLRSNHNKSCGCIKIESAKKIHKKGKEHKQYKGYGDIIGSMFSRIVAGARRRKIEINITIKDIDELWKKQCGKCALSGVDLVLADNCKDLKVGVCTASLDRIDSSKGYLLDNIQWVHKDLNYMKTNYSSEAFLSWCKLIYLYHLTK